MILAQIANTSYNLANLNRLLPQERELLTIEDFESLEALVKECVLRERYILIKSTLQLNPGEIEELWNEVSIQPYCVVLREDDILSLTGNAIKECEGNWDKLKDLGYSLIIKENKNAEDNNVKGAALKSQEFVG